MLCKANIPHFCFTYFFLEGFSLISFIDFTLTVVVEFLFSDLLYLRPNILFFLSL